MIIGIFLTLFITKRFLFNLYELIMLSIIDLFYFDIVYQRLFPLSGTARCVILHDFPYTVPRGSEKYLIPYSLIC